MTLLSQPVVAVALGILLGVGLLLVSRLSFKLITSEDAARGLALVGAALVGRLFFAVAVMFGYHAVAPHGFPGFGLALAGSFLVTYTVELVRFAGLHRYTRPAAGSRDGR